MNALIAHEKYDNGSDRYTAMNNEQITKIPDQVLTKQIYTVNQLSCLFYLTVVPVYALLSQISCNP